MKIYIEKEERIVNFKFKGTVKELLIKLKINSETVLVTRNNELVQESDNLKEADSVKILSVVSGG